MLTEKTVVSVIIPVYKTEKYLKKCVESVISQTYPNIEIVLVDDGSPDGAPRICDEFAIRFNSVKVIHKENGGLSDARNCGLTIATGKYVLFLDSDDTIAAETISSMVEIAEREESDIVIPDRYYKCYEGKNDKVLCRLFDSDKIYKEKPIEFALDVVIERGCAWRSTSVLYKTDVIKNNNCLFPKGYTAEDVVFNLSVMSYAKKSSFIKEPTLNYLKRQGSITTSFNRTFFDNILYIDGQVTAFLENNCIVTTENIRKRNSLFCRNCIVYLFSVYGKNNGLSVSEKKSIADAILNHDRFAESISSQMTTPFFDKKMLGIIIVVIQGLLRMKCKALAIFLIKMINSLR